MDAETIVRIIAGLAAIAVVWAWRRFDVSALSHTYDSAMPDEPCWTEQIRAEGGLSYGRYGCHHSQLAEMEARARTGEFDTPA